MIEYLLISQALLAIGAFVRCSINSSFQKKLTVDTLKLASKLLESPSLSLRRAALVAMHASVESRLQQRKLAPTSTSRMETIDDLVNANSALGVLTNISRLGGGDGEGGSYAVEDEDVIIAAFVEWAVPSIRNDPDPYCRALKVDAVEIAFVSLGL